MGNIIQRYIERQKHSSALVEALPQQQSRSRPHRRRVWARNPSSFSSKNNNPSTADTEGNDDDDSEKEDFSSNTQKDVCYSFHWKKPSSHQKSVFHSLRERYGEIGNKIMYRSCCSHLHSIQQEDISYTYETFNDLPDYLRLSSSPDVTRVELYKVTIQLLSNKIIGFQSHYKLHFHNGFFATTAGTDHLSFFYTKRYINAHAQQITEPSLLHYNEMSTENFELLEEENEFISGLYMYTEENENGGELVGMKFVTNRRVVSIGSCNPACYNDDNDESRIKHSQEEIKISSNNAPHIVALTGVSMIGHSSTQRNIHCIQKIGYYTENNAWAVLGPLVMLRWLYEEDRAVKKMGEEEDIGVMGDLVELPDEMWRHVLSFLVA